MARTNKPEGTASRGVLIEVKCEVVKDDWLFSHCFHVKHAFDFFQYRMTSISFYEIVVDTMDMVWISICYPIEYEQTFEVKEALNIDTSLYKIEISVLLPIISKTLAAPIIIDCDNNVKLFISANGKEQIGNMNNEEEHDRTYNDGNDDNGDGIFVDYNGFDVSEDSLRRLDDEVNSHVANDNNFELHTHEPYSRNIVNGNDVESTQIVSASLLAVKCHFYYKAKNSNKSTYTIVCIDENCKWRLRATKIVESPIFEVRKYNGHHSYSMSVHHRDHRHASYMITGNHIAPKYEDVNRVYRPRDIINDIRREFGIIVSYTKAYMVKNFACGLIHGKPRESYTKLPAYCHVLEMQNPGTLTFIHTNDDRHFKYLFMALGPSIHGFLNSMRKVISIDGAFLTSRMKGDLLKLRLITGDTDDLVIISDRAMCIKNGVRNMFRFAYHGNCTYHLQKNLKTNFSQCDVVTLFRAASETYTVIEFEPYMTALYSKKEGIKEYLLEEDFHYWARAHFTGIRYNIITTNNTESINGLLKSARELPIVGLIE
ncbi:uncharacterized protein LOC111366964 [Olea europaea var. sylvestris]|uniref:uncharacterized protein LOC111366964 n=1 Tax=Olea europaea var. sylvestris TaxID=158386 RepID=UPI000C1D86B3|nr:uncharacterized protein LOC111366964 [Olea europaea var. sylvestris]